MVKESRSHRCAKGFKNGTALLQHMNQPYASCRLRFENPPSPHHRPSRASIQRPQLFNNAGTSPEAEMPDLTGSHAAAVSLDTTWDGDVSMNMEEDLPVRQHTNASYFIEEHPGASKIFGQGETLLDHFYNDEYSHLRAESPYYPFASHGEWELASFLLRSNLSMSALDDFFKLSMVMVLNILLRVLYGLIRIHRLNVSLCPSAQLRICAVGLSCFLLGQSGNAKLGILVIRQSSQSSSFTEIPWSASSPFCKVRLSRTFSNSRHSDCSRQLNERSTFSQNGCQGRLRGRCRFVFTNPFGRTHLTTP
jgi:hypothetical protein